jgi:hypothetical protein
MIRKIKNRVYDKEEGLKKFLTDVSGVIIGLVVYIVLQITILP